MPMPIFKSAVPSSPSSILLNIWLVATAHGNGNGGGPRECKGGWTGPAWKLENSGAIELACTLTSPPPMERKLSFSLTLRGEGDLYEYDNNSQSSEFAHEIPLAELGFQIALHGDADGRWEWVAADSRHKLYI